MSEYFSEQENLRGRVKVELDVSNYETKSDFQKCKKCF